MTVFSIWLLRGGGWFCIRTNFFQILTCTRNFFFSERVYAWYFFLRGTHTGFSRLTERARSSFWQWLYLVRFIFFSKSPTPPPPHPQQTNKYWQELHASPNIEHFPILSYPYIYPYMGMSYPYMDMWASMKFWPKYLICKKCGVVSWKIIIAFVSCTSFILLS